MYVKTVYDLGNPELDLNVPMLYLNLDKEIEFILPDGRPVTGILTEVNPMEGGRLVELVIEIDDVHQKVFSAPMN